MFLFYVFCIIFCSVQFFLLILPSLTALRKEQCNKGPRTHAGSQTLSHLHTHTHTHTHTLSLSISHCSSIHSLDLSLPKHCLSISLHTHTHTHTASLSPIPLVSCVPL